VPSGLPDATSATELAGLAAATTTAVLWAGSSVLYGRAGERLTAAWLNFVKGVIATILLALTLVILGKPLLAPFAVASTGPILLLALSGVIGISFGDTAYFASIRRVGARQAALLSLLSVPAASAGGLLFLNERLPLLGVGGIAITVAGIAWVVAERPAAQTKGAVVTTEAVAPIPGGVAAGILLGLAAAICQAVGALMNRWVIRTGEFDDLWSATWRLCAAALALTLFLPFFPRRPPGSSGRGRLWAYLLPAILMGSYAGIWLQQIALSRADTGYVQTLFSTTPIWILPMAMLAGERVTWRAALGSAVGLGGVALLIFSTRGG
jgi:drug/metabolite transporter (DMT)-like permease